MNVLLPFILHLHVGLYVIYGACEATEDDWKLSLDQMRSRTPAWEQVKVVEEMIKRRLPDDYHLFDVDVQLELGPRGRDTFQILPSHSSSNESRMKIIGSSGVAASYGLLHYLKNYCNAHVSWEADQLQLPVPLPAIHLNITSKDRFRYYENVCTVSYSFVWWDWNRWERHIDWMALNGINLPLAFTGQEAIWNRIYRRMNLTQEELDDHFAGPPFLAWGRMGNIRKWGGPLSASWLDKRLQLQHTILSRMRGFGMTPVLPAFAGHVPGAIQRVYPEANVTRLRKWGHFSEQYTSTFLLDPTDPLFQQIGSDFIRELEEEFNGTDHFYNCDTFNEMSPPSDSPEYLSSVGSSVFRAMTTQDPKAIWVMQGWLFLNDRFWTYNASKALITSVPQGKMLILDLASERSPVYPRLDSYFGQPFIFCMLHNFGGVKGMYGGVDVLLQNLDDARNFPNVTLAGIGITMEGIEQNYVMYDFLLELGWKEPSEDVSQWAAAYARRRYGNYSQKLLGESWRLLMNGIYNDKKGIAFHGDRILMMRRPDFKRMAWKWYEISDLITAWDLMIQAAEISNPQLLHQDGNKHENAILPSTSYSKYFKSFKNKGGLHIENGLNTQETFQHDIVDLTRQVLQIRADRLVQALRFSYLLGSETFIKKSGSALIELLVDLDQLLGTSDSFLLGKWMQGATDWSSSNQEEEQFRRNSLHQVTLWGPRGELVDYAVKQWNGLIKNYIIPRWRLFTNYLLDATQNGTIFNQKLFDVDVFLKVEKPFAMATNISYPAEPIGDPVESAVVLYKKYRKYF